jgi:hypothetical protein
MRKRDRAFEKAVAVLMLLLAFGAPQIGRRDLRAESTSTPVLIGCFDTFVRGDFDWNRVKC